MFDIGDKIYKNESSVPYTVDEIDTVTGPMPKYKLIQENFSFWDYCIGWKKLVTSDDVLRYGDVLTDDSYYVDGLNGGHHRIRTIQYESRIFYHKMINGEVAKFKELTV